MVPGEELVAACGICALIARLRAGSFADFIAELPRSWLILGDAQFYRGYCVLLAKRHVNELHAMPRAEAHQLLDETLAVGRTLSEVLKPLKLNYECLGNQEPHVHWHVFPRYADDQLRTAPVWQRAKAERSVVLDEPARTQLIAALRGQLLRQARGPHLTELTRRLRLQPDG